MEKFITVIQQKMMPIADRLSSMNFLNALGKTFQILLPVFMIGSFAALGAFLDIAPWQSFIAGNGLNVILMNIQSVTLSIIAFYVLLVLPYQYAQSLNMNAISATVLSVMFFLIVTPTELYTSIPMQWLGYPGLFGVMVISAFVVRATKFLLDKKIYIRMPKGVPPIVEDSFASIVPALLLMIIAVLIKQGLQMTSYDNLHNIIYSMIQQPLSNIGLSFPSYLMIQVLSTLLMFCGIHGNTIFGIVTPLAMAASAENLAALANNQALPNIVTNSFSVLCQPGGIGGTLGLTIMLVFMARSQRLKTLGRMSIVPAVFGINEPVIFGIPILLNPIMFIPFVINPIICTTISYLSIWSGLVPRLSGTDVNWTMPQILSGFLAQGWQAAVLQVVLIVITTLIWFPFFRIIDKKIYSEEQAAIEEVSA